MKTFNDKKPDFKRGSIIGWEWFYVIVNTKGGWINCICDNANNIYSFKIDDVLKENNPHEWMLLNPEDFDEFDQFVFNLGENYKHLAERGIPFDVVVESLIKRHDWRFE